MRKLESGGYIARYQRNRPLVPTTLGRELVAGKSIRGIEPFAEIFAGLDANGRATLLSASKMLAGEQHPISGANAVDALAALSRLSRLLHQSYEGEGLSPKAVTILSNLVRNGPQQILRLTGDSDINVGNVYHLVAEMERRGLVQRSSEDGSRVLTATAAAYGQFDHHGVYSGDQHLTKALAHLEVEEQVLVSRVLADLADRLGKTS